MNVLSYALPLFLNQGETYEYTKEFIYAFIKENNTFPISFLKEKQIKSSISNISIVNLDFCTNENMLSVRNFIKENNIKIYHCLNNGFSLFPYNRLKKVSTVNTILPITNPNIIDIKYVEKFNDKIETTLDICNKIIVPFNYMKNELLNSFNINEDTICVIPPVISPIFLNVNEKASKIYIKSKFKIDFEYVIYIGEINNRNTLIETLDIFYILYMHNRNLKLILSVTYFKKNEALYNNLLSYIEQLNIEEAVILMKNISDIDKMHLLKNSLCFLYLNSYNELNITILQCLALNTKILCLPTESNLEALENYPIYYTDSLDFKEILFSDFYFDDFEKEFILNKFDFINNTLLLYELYQSLY